MPKTKDTHGKEKKDVHAMVTDSRLVSRQQDMSIPYAVGSCNAVIQNPIAFVW